MKLNIRTLVGVAATTVGTVAGGLFAEVVEYMDKDQWIADVGAFVTLDFVDFWDVTDGTSLFSDQYADFGVIFGETDESFTIWHPFECCDGGGFWGFGGTWLHFDEPMQWLSVDHPGVIKMDLYYEGEMIHSSNLFNHPADFNIHFSGLVSSMPFDTVYLYKPWPFNNNVFVDDLHFGPPIPAPGALGLLGLAALLGSGRNRRRRGRA